MNPNRIFSAIFILLFAFSCSQPVATSLLTNESSNSGDDTSSDSGSTEGQIEISADNSEISVSVDDTDKVEITGKCTDLDRRKNRILVEVFAGEDETATPYISNAISDFCQTVDSGLAVGSTAADTCFWVTKGIGIVELPPVSRSFPQCHDGVFGFAVKLGKILVNGGFPPLKYTVRFKLRTLDGILADSPWSRVTVTRTLNSPSVDRVSANDLNYSCLVETSPARFNPQISYMLTKKAVGNAAEVVLGDVYALRLNSSIITPNASVYSWLDFGPGKGIIAGATYSYTLDSLHTEPYPANPYAPGSEPRGTSNTLTCTIARPQIFMPEAPTNSPRPAGTGPTCYLAPSGGRANPNIGGSYELQWGKSTVAGWTGIDGAFAGDGDSVIGCLTTGLTNCNATDLTSGVQYYFAVREKYTAGPLVGKWSNEVACTPP